MAVLAILSGLVGRRVEACSPSNPDGGMSPIAIPRSGATDVSTATSFVILSGVPPVGLALNAGDAGVPLGPLTSLGVGESDMAGLSTNFWQVQAGGGFLPASSDLELSASDGKGGRVVLTSVHTAAGYDKQAGTPAVLKSLTLTRVRYPIAEIGSGDCVFSQYIGYISFDADPAVIPGTPPDSVVNTISLASKYGGAAVQSRTFTGARAYTGDRVQDPTSSWMPFLDPSLEYCAGITSFGNGDVARLPLRSNAVCVRVREIALPGAGDDAGADAPAMGDSSGSGGTGGATDAGTSSNDDGGKEDASAGVERPHVAAGDGPPSCAAAGGTGRPSPLAIMVVGFAGLLAVRRRSVTRRR